MELYVQEGGQSSQSLESSAQPGDWTIFPFGWPGPDPSFGIVKSLKPGAAIVHDVFFGMDVEFRIDLVETLTPDRRSRMSPKESASLERATRAANTPWEDRKAA